MSLKATSEAWQASGISPTAKLVLLAIAEHADEDGLAWPSIARLEALTGLARSSVCRLLDEIEAAGLIERQRGGPAGRESTRYRMKWSDCGTTSGSKWSDHETSPTVKLVPPSVTSSPTVGPQVVPPSDPNRKGTVRNRQSTVRSANASASECAAGSLVEFPLALSSPSFAVTWAEWAQHRREIRRPLTPTSARQQLTKLEAMGSDRAIEAIRHSIANGWRGIFEPSPKDGARQLPAATARGVSGYGESTDISAL